MEYRSGGRPYSPGPLHFGVDSACGVGWSARPVATGCVWSGSGVGFHQLPICGAESAGRRWLRSGRSRSSRRLCPLAAAVSDAAGCVRLPRVRPLGRCWSVECGHLRGNRLRCWSVASTAHSIPVSRRGGLSCRHAGDPLDQGCILCHVRDAIHPVYHAVVGLDRRVSPWRQANGSGLGGGVHGLGLPHSVYWRCGASGCRAADAPSSGRCAAG